MFLDRIGCWQLAYLFADKKRKWDNFGSTDIISLIPPMCNWIYAVTHLGGLVKKLKELPPMVDEAHAASAEREKVKRQGAALVPASIPVRAGEDDTREERAEKDCTLAIPGAITI